MSILLAESSLTRGDGPVGFRMSSLLARKIDPDRRGRPQAGHGEPEPIWSPDAVLMDRVARLQLDLDEIRAESRRLRTQGGRDSPSQLRQVTFIRDWWMH